MRKVNLAVVGATGAVGRTILQVLEDRSFDFDKLYLFASKKSVGKKLKVNGQEYAVEELTPTCFKGKGIDIALFSCGGDNSKIYAPIAKEEGIVVVDNSSQWRMTDGIPLVVPEVNAQAALENTGIIANPNCSTIISLVPLKPLYDKYGIKRIVFNTYQAVSGSGMAGIRDLENGTCEKYPYSISKNCLPHIDVFLDNGYTKEEMKMVNETRKIFHDDTIQITATTVRVPIKNSHAISVNVELNSPFELSDIFELMKQADGVVLQDDLANEIYPLQDEVSGKDEVYVGRIRRDFSIPNGLNFWCVGDNIRKGAATNTVEIAELVQQKM